MILYKHLHNHSPDAQAKGKVFRNQSTRLKGEKIMEYSWVFSMMKSELKPSYLQITARDSLKIQVKSPTVHDID